MVRRSQRAVALCVAGTLALLAADLGTKEWAAQALAEDRVGTPPPLCEGRSQRINDGNLVLIDGYLEMQYAENCGAAFGLLRDADDWLRRVVFGLAALGAAVTLMWMFVTGRGGTLFAWSVPFVVSGAVGNLVDRVRQGYVVDFIRFHLQETWEYPTFNVADITIVIGVALLFLDGLRKEKSATPGPAVEAENAAPPSSKRKKGGRKRVEADRAES